jgi:enoyl-CoA hydratase/carnithine racemase
VSTAVPADALDEEVAALADTLIEKNQLALRFNADVFDRARRSTFDDSQQHERAKLEELSYLQGIEWIDEGIGQFSAGDYRPGVSTYRIGGADDAERSGSEDGSDSS